jgi:putative hydrolase of HD superfamily
MSNFTGIVNFIFEINNMKRFEHCGSKFAGVKHPDSLAEHVFRTTQIAYILARLEGLDDSQLLRVLEIALFHDNGEVRVGDFHKIASKYIDSDEAEQKAYEDQLSQLPAEVSARLQEILVKYNQKEKSIEYIIAKDADLLETVFQAKEYMELGYPTSRWIENAEQYLTTTNAKEILKFMKTKSLGDWWNDLNRA